MASPGLRRFMFMGLLPLFTTTQGVSPSSIITLDMTTTFPVSLSDMANITLTCNLDAKNTSFDFLRVMELTICEHRKSKSPKTLASINFLVPVCTTHGHTNSLTATGELGLDHGHLRVESSKGKDDVDVVDFVCVAKYINHQLQPETVKAQRKSELLTLFSLIARQNSENSALKTMVLDLEEVLTNRLSHVDAQLQNVLSALSTLEKTGIKNQEDIAGLTSRVTSLNDTLREPESCNELRLRRQASSARQQVRRPDGTTVLCDTETDEGGWTIFQRRVDGKESFARGWTEYVQGFGDLRGDFWMGLEHLHRLTEEGPQELRVDFTFNNHDYFAHYSTFQVLDLSTNYKLQVGGHSGTAGNDLSNNMQFSTYDADHDTWGGNCASEYANSGWWFNSCHSCELNGEWGSTEYGSGLNWRSITGYHASATFTEMKARPLYRGL